MIVIAPARAPLAEGVNVTEIVHEAPPASAAPQLLVCVKSVEDTILPIEIAVEPLFLSVTGMGALAVPCAVAGKVMLVGLTVVATAPVPLSAMV